ncbi:MAG: glycoside hydrolase family 15 protein [Desulfobacteraceae bacterium]|nr:glycoside hydrolase family 15 protein [Desulfobacteraceae bacterium]
MATVDSGVYQRLGDYGIIGNSRTAALVGRNGSIDWLCLPHLDSPSVFAAILDDRRGGRFALTPEEEWDATAAYRPGTNVLATTFRIRHGQAQLTDFMPVSAGEARQNREGQEIYRRLEVVAGEVAFRLRFEPRFDYARAETLLSREGDIIVAAAGRERLTLAASAPGLAVEGNVAVARWTLKEGERVWLRLGYGTGEGGVDSGWAEAMLAETEAWWREWLASNETGQDLDLGPFAHLVERSALVLKLLALSPSGAIAAAPTTSLPEAIGGVRNWDYRFSWVRDSALTVEALFHIGHLSEMDAYLRWLEGVLREPGAALQVLYGLRGERETPEQELSHLEGYKGSAPVRIGNGAQEQKQLDIYGEVLDAAFRLSNYVGKIDAAIWPFFRRLCNRVLEEWQEPDSGIWEVRGGPRHFVHSKVMCWVALDRGLTIARRYGFPAETAAWTEARERIRGWVLTRGWHEGKQAFVQHEGSEALDASALLMPFYGFLAHDDPRMVSTVAAIERELVAAGFVYRYRAPDGLPGGEGVFLACTFWLVDNLIGQGRLEEARTMLLRLEAAANHLGLFAEEHDPFWREPLGNFPQAFTHIGYINSAVSLCLELAAREKRPREITLPGRMEQRLLVTRTYVLNEGEPPARRSSAEIAGELKGLMNVLRGGFFRAAAGRVAYEEMAGSRAYREYAVCSRLLRDFDLRRLRSSQERLAFWINLYNVLVIHGVIELGVRDSVREVGRFFRRIRYRIGGQLFSADDIEHGILRGNQRLPNSPCRPFGLNDPRRRYRIKRLDPRIHFALVCASSSCPPIEIYGAENLDEELAVSGRTFLNAGGLRLDRDRRTVYLSRIFHWYGNDFGASRSARLRFVAPYLYREEERQYLEEHAGELRIRYLPYDWRLNRFQG